MIVGERQRGALDRAPLGAEQSGGEADQAGLAAAVGPRDLQRFAGVELEVQTFEQQPPAAPQRNIIEAQQRASFRAVLERVHVVVGEAEMMADLVDHDVRDELLEADPRPTAIRRGSAGGRA